jgi:hypothetical protein
MIASLLAAALLGQSYYTPAEAQALFAESNEAFYAERYDEAIAGYEKLASRSLGGAEVLFNLGTAHLAKGELGPAVLYLERARRLGGEDEDLEANLAVARARQLDKVIGATATEPLVVRVASVIAAPWVGWLFVGLWLCGAGALLLLRYASGGARLWGGVLAGALLLAAVPAGMLTAVQWWVAERVVEGVVMVPTLQAREQPSPNAKVSFEVHAGLKVRLLETEGRFVKLRLPNGLVAWAEKEGLAKL